MLKAIGAIAVVTGLVFLTPILGVLAGAFCGWVISILAPVWVPTGLGLFGVHVVASQLVEFGAALGFIGGFFHITRNSKAEGE